MDKIESLNHTKWGCKHHVVFMPKFRRKTLYLVRDVPSCVAVC